MTRTWRAPGRFTSRHLDLEVHAMDFRVVSVGLQVLGMSGQAYPFRVPVSPECLRILRPVANTIEGGTREIQRNVIATRGRRLPQIGRCQASHLGPSTGLV